MTSFIARHRVLSGSATFMLLCLLLMGGCLHSRMRGPYHDYELDFMVPDAQGTASPGGLRVGVAKRDISPVLEAYDSWTDVNNNGKFDKKVDSFIDRNGNGKFDGIWLAGFGSNRPAKGIHDPLWARAIALRNNGVLVVMVTLDSIGIFHNEYIAIREDVDPSLGIDHIMFSATHSHEVPDTMKIWSGRIPILGYQKRYIGRVQRLAVEAVEEAVRGLAPADMYCTKVAIEPEGFVCDAREPQVMDKQMYLMRFTEAGADNTIATIVNWGNHPETLGSHNSLVTSDFPHYLREGVEKGVPEPYGVEGLGGMCLYFQGMIGGLMTQLDVEVPHRDGLRKFEEDSFEKAEALGQNLAIVACTALRGNRVWKDTKPRIAAAGRTFLAPMQGRFKWAIMLGLIHEGYYCGAKAKTEVNVIRIGGVVILTVPGELYPEIVEGGIEVLPGRDHDVPALETPPLRDEMNRRARMAFVVGLANDEIGYIIPKSQWDTKHPYIYEKSQYGEENSPGPDVALTYHREALGLLKQMNADF
jgi:neutral/alkaline ceramidase-like enzyme